MRNLIAIVLIAFGVLLAACSLATASDCDNHAQFQTISTDVPDFADDAPAVTQAATSCPAGGCPTASHTSRKVFRSHGPIMDRGPARRAVKGTARGVARVGAGIVRGAGRLAKAVLPPYPRVRANMKSRQHRRQARRSSRRH